MKEKWNHIVPRKEKSTSSNVILHKIHVNVKNHTDYLSMDTDESYSLSINNTHAILNAKTIYGAMQGLETIAQLITYNGKHQIQYTPIKIQDEPKYQHRGLLLDTVRNYYPIKSINKVISTMSYNKMNVFHWHLFDATSFPFKSEKYPKLWKEGAYSQSMVYSKSDIAKVIRYAAERGIRVIPEIEAPAHTYIIGKVYPELGVCLDDDEFFKTSAEPPSGQLDPTNPQSIKIISDLIDELSEVFHDQYMHMSGDEVNYNCWETSEKINKYMKGNNLTMNDLFLNFSYKMHEQTKKNKKSVMVWQEMLLQHNATLPKDALVQVWLGPSDTKKIINRGHDVIASSYEYWYLDCGHGGWVGNNTNGQSWCEYRPWQKVYSYDPVANLTKEEAKGVKGGEVALWSEQIDDVNVEQYLWPRASAAAEVLWFGHDGLDSIEALDRLNNWRYRLVKRGVRAEALQPLWCVKNPQRCNMR